MQPKTPRKFLMLTHYPPVSFTVLKNPTLHSKAKYKLFGGGILCVHFILTCTVQLLRKADEEIIRSGQYLQSEQIHLAVQLIREKYPKQQGLLCTLAPLTIT